MNKLYIGFSKRIDLPTSKFLFIDDEIPEIYRARIFNPLKDHFNPLAHIDYRRARQLVDVLYTTTPQGENTLTVRNGKRALLKAILDAKRFDEIDGDEEVTGMIDDLLVSPVLRRVLCTPGEQFSFAKNSIILARINRAELGDFDALVLGLLLIGQAKGQLVVPDFGFYGREAHVSLIREERLIAGVNFLHELPLRLRQASLLIQEKDAEHATFEDAQLLANYAGKATGTQGFKDYVQTAIE